MKISSKTAVRFVGTLASMGTRYLSSTLDYRVAYYDTRIDPAYFNEGGPRIYIFWHEYILFFICLRRHCNLAMLLSRHSDADILEDVANRFGFGAVRGSTNRGGMEALRELMRREKQDSVNLTITPDGPRGPRRTLAPGCIFLASKLQIPLVVLGVGYDRPFRFRSWDRFAIPRPGSRVRCIPSFDIRIPPRLDREGLEYYRRRVESLLNNLTQEAEEWAVAGDSYVNESSVLSGPCASLMYFARPKAAYDSVLQF